jgi:hypothetical protein
MTAPYHLIAVVGTKLYCSDLSHIHEVMGETMIVSVRSDRNRCVCTVVLGCKASIQSLIFLGDIVNRYIDSVLQIDRKRVELRKSLKKFE